MTSNLKDKRQFFRFLSINILGTVADFLLAVLLVAALSSPPVFAATFGFVVGSAVNYCGHNIFSYEHTSRHTISVRGFAKYLLAVLFSLVVRLAVVAGLGFATDLPFWLILLVAIGASFVASYVISTIWVFRKPG
ncbi:GtrA family protein [Ruegeria sediminis]|uniref:GtrA family protein n=1 Tax=Ruegeria sediminis TaxID=2583820 RepID=A0ABY2WW64_9RHOB|nr:GtrA family protein [Ruegeria sediminis]TMV07003.1 GtrA family protein [Ruegeria sediminis]